MIYREVLPVDANASQQTPLVVLSLFLKLLHMVLFFLLGLRLMFLFRAVCSVCSSRITFNSWMTTEHKQSAARSTHVKALVLC